ADDGRVYALGDEGLDGLDVGKRAHAAGGDDRRVGGGGHVAQELQVRAGEGAVLGDVGDHEAGAALGVEALEDLPQVAAVGDPAAAAEAPLALDLADVHADGDAVAVLADDALAPLGVLQRGGADVHAAAARGQRGLQGLVVADAAGQLHVDVELADDVAQQLVVRAAAERRVEVDEVDPLRAGVLPVRRGIEGRAVVGLGARGALDQANGLAVGDVNGGQEGQGHGGVSPPGDRVQDSVSGLWAARRRVARGDHRKYRRTAGQARVPTQLRSSARPASPDFSGWNWVAQRGPFSTAATNESLSWVARETSGAAMRDSAFSSQRRTP